MPLSNPDAGLGGELETTDAFVRGSRDVIESAPSLDLETEDTDEAKPAAQDATTDDSTDEVEAKQAAQDATTDDSTEEVQAKPAGATVGDDTDDSGDFPEPDLGVQQPPGGITESDDSKSTETQTEDPMPTSVGDSDDSDVLSNPDAGLGDSLTSEAGNVTEIDVPSTDTSAPLKPRSCLVCWSLGAGLMTSFTVMAATIVASG